MKTHNIILSLTFILILLLPVSNWFLHFINDIEGTENRGLAEMPEFNVNNLDPFPTKFESFHKDHFFIRNRINKKWSEINRGIFKKSPTDKALIGRDGWLFIKKDELKTYLGQNLFTNEELTRFKHEIIRRRDYLDSMDCKYYFVIAPTKYSVYPEYLSWVYDLRGENYTMTDQVFEIVSEIENVQIIDLRVVLNKSKARGLLYRPTDNHWNALGAYYAYTEILNRVSKDFPEIGPCFPLDSFNVETQEVPGGNVAYMMNASNDYHETIPKISFKAQKVWEAEKSGYVSPPYFGFKSEYELVYTNNETDAPKALIIRDSFGHALTPYISAHFGKTVLIFDEWKYMLNQPIVDNEKPDIFIQMTLECFYNKLLANEGK